jgi:hypothetical protein
MKNNLQGIILFLVGQYCFSQTQERKPLHGQVVNDSIAVENGYVFNLNSKQTTFIGVSGFFDLQAKPKDTLLITSLALKSKKIVLNDMDFKERLYVVKMELFDNQLKEVIVNKKITPRIAGSQEIVDMKFMDDAQSSPINRTMPYYGIENGADLGRIMGLVVGLFKKKNGEKQPVIPDEIFMDKIQRDFKPEFFKNTLKLKPEEVNLFLIYCDTDDKAKKVLRSKDKFQIMDFLITKNQEFKNLLQTSSLPK